MAGFVSWWLDSRCPLAGLPSARGLESLAAFAFAVAALGYILPGRKVEGTLLADGTRLTYKCNGLLVSIVFVAGLFLSWSRGYLPPTWIAERGGELFATTFAVSVVLSLWLQFVGTTSSATSASLKPRSHGNVLLNFWLGTQLNPLALGFVDLKWFCLRLGMLGWLVLNLGAAAKQYTDRDGQLSAAMVLYQVFTGLYVVDFFWYEEFMTSTWDIIAECFGFMLVFGDLVWIPYTFSMQAWWLLKHDPQISSVLGALSAVTFIIGYLVFRGANAQKHLFKKDPTQKIWGKTPRVVGGRLLASGYWGMARHCNYLGDLLLALSFSLPCGFSSAVPYFYPIYLLILLINRERRDEAKCREKYREIWKEYCSVVPWRILPYVY